MSPDFGLVNLICVLLQKSLNKKQMIIYSDKNLNVTIFTFVYILKDAVPTCSEIMLKAA